jgi:tetratricopeptide (TPR) repeat protein
VLQELIAALDSMMVVRRRQGRPEAEWGRLYRVADQLDRDERQRQLRALLVKVPERPATGAAGLTDWESARKSARRELLDMRTQIEVPKAPVLTVILLAQAFAVVGDRAGEEEVLRQAVAAHPGQVVLLDALGKFLERQGRLGDAIGYYQAARGQRPDLGVTLVSALLRAGRAPEAEDVLQELRPLQPDNYFIYFYLGYAAYEQKKYSDAEAAYHKAIGLKNDFAEAYHNLANALTSQKKYAAAEAAYRKAIDLLPNPALTYRRLGLALVEQDKYDEGEAAIRKAIELQPEDAASNEYHHLGNALSMRQQYARAEVAYRKAIELKPDLASAYMNLGNVLFGQKKPAAAEAAYRKAIDFKPDLVNAYSNLGKLLLVQPKHAAAEPALRKAIALKPDFANAYFDLGVAVLAQDRFAEAEVVFRKGIALTPNDPEFHYNLGAALYRQQKVAEAEAAFRKAIDLRPNHDLAHFLLGVVLRRQARFDEAAAALKVAGALLPAKDPRREQARQLQQQCQRFAILDARLAAVLQGTEKTASAAEQIELAQLCLLKKDPIVAARFSRDAFTADPQLAENVPADARYNAACAAALAGCGQGKDANKLDDQERALWRSQALEWLRQDLTWWDNALRSGNAASNSQVRQKLRHWQIDGDLAGVRAKDALARLREEERKQWESLWSNVDAMLRRVSEPE